MAKGDVKNTWSLIFQYLRTNQSLWLITTLWKCVYSCQIKEEGNSCFQAHRKCNYTPVQQLEFNLAHTHTHTHSLGNTCIPWNEQSGSWKKPGVICWRDVSLLKLRGQNKPGLLNNVHLTKLKHQYGPESCTIPTHDSLNPTHKHSWTCNCDKNQVFTKYGRKINPCCR